MLPYVAFKISTSKSDKLTRALMKKEASLYKALPSYLLAVWHCSRKVSAWG